MEVKTKDGLHLSRWQRHKDGLSIEKIAEEDRVTLGIVRKSIRRIEERKNLFSMGTLQTAQVENILSVKDQELQSWKDAFKAKVKTSHDTPFGTVISEEIDHDTALAASSEITARIAALHPRQGISITNQANAGAVAGGAAGTSFQSKLRDVLQRRKQEQKQPEVIDVPLLPAGEDDDESLNGDPA